MKLAAKIVVALAAASIFGLAIGREAAQTIGILGSIALITALAVAPKKF